MQAYSLKSKAKSKISLDVIQEVLNKEKSCPFTIMVVDDYTAKILSFYMTMSEVLNKGVFSLERLNIKRQPFPNYTVIYFVSPTKESCELIKKDFDDENNPTYGNVHIYFSSRALETHLNILATETLAPKIKAIYELNLSYFSRNNYFDFNLKSLNLFSMTTNNKNTERRLILNDMKDKLLTMIIGLKEYPYIQYQDSPLCTEFSSMLNSSLYEMSELKLLNPKRNSICLIVDRSYDMTTPVLHDYTYKAIVFDFFDVSQEGFINIPTEGISNYKLSDDDFLWQKYKNCHIGDVLKNIQADVEEFNKSDLAKQNNSNLDNFDDMIKVVENVKGYREKHQQFNVHLKLCNKILKVGIFYIRFLQQIIFMK